MKTYKYIYLIVGDSGSGKSTVIEEYCRRFDKTQILSYTTRPIRDCERLKPTHTHISLGRFSQLFSELVAYDKYNNFYYGATINQVLDNDFYVINKNGIDFINEKFPNLKYKVVLISTKSKNLVDRMLTRGDSIEQINSKLCMDTQNTNIKYDYKLYNNTSVDDAVNNLYNYINGIESLEKGENFNE